MRNDRPHIPRPGSILLTVLPAAVGYLVAGLGAAVVIVVILGFVYVTSEREDEHDGDELYVDPPVLADDEADPQNALRWGISVAFVFIGSGIAVLAFLPFRLPFVLAHLAVTLIVAIIAGQAAYRIMGGAR